jgi:hypothetical protein
MTNETTITPQDHELVNVAIPKPLLPDVTAMLHRFYSGGTGANGSAAAHASGQDEEVSVPNNGTWNRKEIAMLHDSFRNEAGRKVITFIAQRSLDDEVATYGELMAHSGLDEYKLRSQFSWFSKKSKATKNMKNGKAWPLIVHDAGSDAEKGERYTYRMPPPIAKWWLEEEGQ